MCLARVKFSGGEGEDREPMSDVARIDVTVDGLVVTDLMGKARNVDGAIKSVDFMESAVVVERRKD